MLAETVAEWKDEWKQENLREGRREGRAEGKREGEMSILLKLLKLNIGPVSENDRNRIRAAGSDELLRWGERVLSAESLEEAFGPSA